jgi:hypothetical protein
MVRIGWVVVFACLALSCAEEKQGDPAPQRDTPKAQDAPASPEEIERVRKILRSREQCGEEQLKSRAERLAPMGKVKVFSAFEAILARPKAPAEIGQVFEALRSLTEWDRSPFVPHAVAALSHENGHVRASAADLLRVIGTAKEAPLVAALLSEREYVVVEAAARALVVIGGPDELAAMDRWLADNPTANPSVRRRFAERRDQLRKRLPGATGQ